MVNLEIIYKNCINFIRFRYDKASQLTSDSSDNTKSSTRIKKIPDDFGLSPDQFRHEISTVEYVTIFYGYICIMLTNPDKNIGSSLPAFRNAINKAIHPTKIKQMNNVEELILITERKTQNFKDVVNNLFIGATHVPSKIRFGTIQDFAFDHPKTISHVPYIKLSKKDIDKDKKFFIGTSTSTGVISHNDVAILWYGFNPGDIVIARPRTFTANYAELILQVV
jgi:hypothetical protein